MMSQYSTRLYLKYKDKSVYDNIRDRLNEISFKKYGFGSDTFDLLEPTNDNSVELTDFSIDKKKLILLINELKKVLKDNVLIIADTINYNEDLMTYLVYNFNDETKYIAVNKVLEDEVEISDLTKWIKNISLIGSEINFINSFGYNIKNKNVKKKRYRYHSLVYASFDSIVDANYAYDNWIIYVDKNGRNLTISELKSENNPIGESDTAYDNYLIDDVPLSETECKEHINRIKEYIRNGSVTTVTYNGVDDKLHIIYYDGDFNEWDIDNDEVKELIDEDYTISECIEYDNINALKINS